MCIRDSFKALPEDIIYDSEGHEMIRCMGDFYPLVRLHQLYNINDAITSLEDGLLMWVDASAGGAHGKKAETDPCTFFRPAVPA